MLFSERAGISKVLRDQILTGEVPVDAVDEYLKFVGDAAQDPWRQYMLTKTKSIAKEFGEPKFLEQGRFFRMRPQFMRKIDDDFIKEMGLPYKRKGRDGNIIEFQ